MEIHVPFHSPALLRSILIGQNIPLTIELVSIETG